jgi:hypothetical protein
MPPVNRHVDVFEDVFSAVYYGLLDLGVDVTKHRCDDLRTGCATAEALGGRQVRRRALAHLATGVDTLQPARPLQKEWPIARTRDCHVL